MLEEAISEFQKVAKATEARPPVPYTPCSAVRS